MRLIKSDRTKKFDEVLEFVMQYGGVEYTAQKINEYSSEAKNSLNNFKDSIVKESMMEFVDFVSGRDF